MTNTYTRWSFIFFICSLLHLMACEKTVKNDRQAKASQNEPAPTTEPTADRTAATFVEQLKAGKELASFMEEPWTLVYHEDNRCDGSTDGQMENLKGAQIDQVIELEVTNDGEGWACDPKDPSSYQYDFNLREKVKQWDRFEILEDESKDKTMVMVAGSGASDYLQLHYGIDHLINKLEYRSEDPG